MKKNRLVPAQIAYESPDDKRIYVSPFPISRQGIPGQSIRSQCTAPPPHVAAKVWLSGHRYYTQLFTI